MLIEAFAAARTHMAALAKVQDRLMPADGDVSYDLGAVVMDFTCDASALRATVEPLFHSQPDMHFILLAFDICDDYIFQLEQFFDTISVEHEVPPLGFVSQLYSTGFRYLMLILFKGKMAHCS